MTAYVRYSMRREPLAQLVEHLTFNQGVAGPSPARLTILSSYLRIVNPILHVVGTNHSAIGRRQPARCPA
jgi:hypothetical protein